MRSLIVLVLILSFNLRAESRDCSKTKEIANEFLSALVEGLSLESYYKSCLDQKNYKLINVSTSRSPGHEAPHCVMDESDTFKVLSIKESGRKRFSVEIEIKLKKACKGKNILRDRFEFMVLGKAAQEASKTCALMYVEPKVIAVKAPCLTQVESGSR